MEALSEWLSRQPVPKKTRKPRAKKPKTEPMRVKDKIRPYDDINYYKSFK